MVTVGVIGPEGDAEVDALARRLRHRGAQPWVLDLGRCPSELPVTWGPDGPRVSGKPLLAMDAAYLRRMGSSLPEPLSLVDTPRPPLPPEAWRALHAPALRALQAEREALALRLALLRYLARRRPVVNPPEVQQLHRQKPYLLQILASAGLRVPAFAAGSDPVRGAWFAAETAGRHGGVVTKPTAGIYKTARLADPREHPWDRRPALLQRLIPGSTVRVYVLAGHLLTAARIVHAGTVDSSESQTGIEVLSPGPGLRAQAEAAAAALRLPFCGLDFVLEPREADRPYLIDCNLSPMFVAFGRLSGCDVAGHLADHLLVLASARTPHRRAPVLDLVDEAKSLLAEDPDLARLLGRATGTVLRSCAFGRGPGQVS